MASFFAGWQQRSTTLMLISLSVFAACQPMTRRDRAVVGPEVTPAQDTNQPSQQTGQDDAGVPSDSPSANASASVSAQWESEQKAACDGGKPSGCSALAYDALRGQRPAVAVQLFTRACLLDESADKCAQTGGSLKGLARSCFELSGLLQKQGQPDDARKFKNCACERGYRPACVM
jgi:hypothetical protein